MLSRLGDLLADKAFAAGDDGVHSASAGQIRNKSFRDDLFQRQRLYVVHTVQSTMQYVVMIVRTASLP